MNLSVKRRGSKGVLEIAFDAPVLNKDPVFLYFLIDVSASMDKDEKLIYVQETIISMLESIPPLVSVFLRIDTFSTVIETIVPTVEVTTSSSSHICKQIWGIQIRNFTNFEVALRNAADVLKQHHLEYPMHRMMHLFFTDGNANTGEVIPKSLAAIMPCDLQRAYHFYMGIGEGHNSMVLHQCAQNPRSEYWYISDPPDIHDVASEVLRKIVYAAEFEEMRITVQRSSSAMLYNWQTDCWSNMMLETHLLDTTKVKRIHVCWKDSSSSTTTSTTEFAIDTGAGLVSEEASTTCDSSAFYYAYEQELTSLLHRCRRYCTQVVESVPVQPKSAAADLRRDLSHLYRRLVKERHLALLAQDCKSALEKMGTYEGILFSNSRQTFFGIQHVYTPRYSKKRKISF
jgi:hypothetical protein